MPTLLLNECDEVQRILREESLLEPAEQVFLLARYYRCTLSYAPKRAEEALQAFVRRTIPDGDTARWTGILHRALACAKDRPLHQLGNLPVSERELAAVTACSGRREQRILFTLIVLARYFNAIHGVDSGWVNLPLRDILRLAGSNIPTADGLEILRRLCADGLIEPRRGIGELALRVVCLDNDGQVALTLHDLRAVGFEYLQHMGYGRFVRCARCGLLVRQSRSNNRRYCDRCREHPSGQKHRMVCIDCRKIFWANSRATRKSRCDACQAEFRRVYRRTYMRKKRSP